MTKTELMTEIRKNMPDAVFDIPSGKYGFNAFCYIPSRTLYIEIFNNYPHFWYEGYDPDLHPEGDEMVTQSDEYINELMLKANKGDAHAEKKLDYWINHLDKRRKCAAKNKLNYVVFWDKNLDDAALWFVLGCPDGKDWEREYSWIPERDIDVLPLYKFTGSPLNLSRIVKHFQFFEFFWREVAMWYNNDCFKNHGRLQGYLYSNRYKYINKKPDELTDAEILRGLSISGVLRGYTVFDAKLMYEVMDKYKPDSIYDPCAGWGERMLACFHKKVKYLGIDINPGLESGYMDMINHYGMSDQRFELGDAVEFINPGSTMVLTCPPYGDTEYYSDLGAENLSYVKFMEWWKKAVSNSTACGPEYFCFQINTRYRDDMLDIVKDAGYELIDELFFKTNKSSHFTRGKNGINTKKNRESMLVLKRR